jgi:hypothetical protein
MSDCESKCSIEPFTIPDAKPSDSENDNQGNCKLTAKNVEITGNLIVKKDLTVEQRITSR